MADEKDLLRRVVAREAGAEEEFVERYRDLVLGLAHGRLGLPREAAEELLQETMMRLWEKDHRALRAWRGQGKLSTYLTVITLRLARERAVGGMEPRRAEGPPPRPLPTPGESVEAQERWQSVRRAFAGGTPRDRLVLALRFLDERSPSEIAQLLGTRPGAARKAIHDALRRLRQRLRQGRPDLFRKQPSASPWLKGREP
ncbi:MAG: sigma-70 family RNA polymerase sigma factor [Acidobacteriota bacterium]